MSGFDIEEVSRRFPAYLSEIDKGRLQNALKDFSSNSKKESIGGSAEKALSLTESQKLYSHFYLRDSPEYLLQADVIESIRRPIWISDRTDPLFATYDKDYIRALMISNTCDIDVADKDRYIPKEVSFVPIVPMSDYIDSIQADHRIRPQVDSIKESLRNQQYSNLFYLPSGKDFEEHIALLDQPFWYPSDELSEILSAVIANRVVSLSQWAYYLFVLKLSYHLCRLPEADDRLVVSAA